MDGGAYGGGKAGAPFDPIAFVQRPQVILRAVCLVSRRCPPRTGSFQGRFEKRDRDDGGAVAGRVRKREREGASERARSLDADGH